jgi:hypothetical protein
MQFRLETRPVFVEMYKSHYTQVQAAVSSYTVDRLDLCLISKEVKGLHGHATCFERVNSKGVQNGPIHLSYLGFQIDL